MGWRIVQQPDGLYARFSEIVDDFTDIDLTEEEAVSLCQQDYGMGQVEAREKVKRGVDAGIARWEEALARIRTVHGDRVAEERLRDVSFQ